MLSLLWYSSYLLSFLLSSISSFFHILLNISSPSSSHLFLHLLPHNSLTHPWNCRWQRRTRRRSRSRRGQERTGQTLRLLEWSWQCEYFTLFSLLFSYFRSLPFLPASFLLLQMWSFSPVPCITPSFITRFCVFSHAMPQHYLARSLIDYFSFLPSSLLPFSLPLSFPFSPSLPLSPSRAMMT